MFSSLSLAEKKKQLTQTPELSRISRWYIFQRQAQKMIRNTGTMFEFHLIEKKKSHSRSCSTDDLPPTLSFHRRDKKKIVHAYTKKNKEIVSHLHLIIIIIIAMAFGEQSYLIDCYR